MCVVSAMGDHFTDKWPFANPNISPHIQPQISPQPVNPGFLPKITEHPVLLPPDYKRWLIPPITREEFDELRKEVLEMKEILKVAVKYDEKHNEPHCELDEKIAVLRKVAELVGVSLDDVFKPNDKK